MTCPNVTECSGDEDDAEHPVSAVLAFAVSDSELAAMLARVVACTDSL